MYYLIAPLIFFMATPIRNSKLYPDLPPVISGAKRRVAVDDKENVAQDASKGIKKQKVFYTYNFV